MLRRKKMTNEEFHRQWEKAQSENDKYNLILTFVKEAHEAIHLKRGGGEEGKASRMAAAFSFNEDYFRSPDKGGLFEGGDKHRMMLVMAQIEIALDAMIARIHNLAINKDNIFLAGGPGSACMKRVEGKELPAYDINIVRFEVETFVKSFLDCKTIFDSNGTEFLVNTLQRFSQDGIKANKVKAFFTEVEKLENVLDDKTKDALEMVAVNFKPLLEDPPKTQKGQYSLRMFTEGGSDGSVNEQAGPKKQ
jgi:hypothetical protein